MVVDRGGGGGGNGETLVKGYKLSVIRRISSSMVTIENNIVLYAWKLLWEGSLSVLTIT